MRESATKSGRPSARSSPRRRRISRSSSVPRSKSSPGSSAICSASTPSSTRRSIRSANQRLRWSTDVVVVAARAGRPAAGPRCASARSRSRVSATSSSIASLAAADVVDRGRAGVERRRGDLGREGVGEHRHARLGARAARPPAPAAPPPPRPGPAARCAPRPRRRRAGRSRPRPGASPSATARSGGAAARALVEGVVGDVDDPGGERGREARARGRAGARSDIAVLR